MKTQPFVYYSKTYTPHRLLRKPEGNPCDGCAAHKKEPTMQELNHGVLCSVLPCFPHENPDGEDLIFRPAKGARPDVTQVCQADLDSVWDLRVSPSTLYGEIEDTRLSRIGHLWFERRKDAVYLVDYDGCAFLSINVVAKLKAWGYKIVLGLI